jgi:hypothetical protein
VAALGLGELVLAVTAVGVELHRRPLGVDLELPQLGPLALTGQVVRQRDGRDHDVEKRISA